MVVPHAELKGAREIATARPSGAERAKVLGAVEVLDYPDPDWPRHARELTGGRGPKSS